MNEKKEDKAPRENPIKASDEKKGLIIINTGGGKGKSTAAFGTALRALGQGFQVAIVQFIKGDWATGEQEALKKYSGKCDFLVMGEGFTWDTKDFARDCASAALAWAKAVELMQNTHYDLLVLDEINYCLQYGFLQEKEVLDALRMKPANKHVILTGNGAPEGLIAIADLVTEMRCIKHPYEKGIKAQRGIEF